ncbi:heavy metal translocating P-type ATPase [Tenuibacillus multivorans]|uniref:Cd(2+)-exporting ATPase n=1 Tax=Tenuibacillus multivorans TaxID=237069 RepID=A0A1H0B9F2_9BACI|nr:heavy metal translocating P-type ATPase [Tenuibacillus multivorans]GEL78601.1 copper-translocating P-type ATPase [Tenuibacillus multivorans]SDN41973.1 Cd2+/Zn2+-exporting ATPase [Tenuibacillus multivorans]
MASEEQSFYVQGMSCANCAKTFENNVKEISTVKNAEVNFGASKIKVEGSASIEQLEKAGSFENLKVTQEYENTPQKSFLDYVKENGNVVGSFILLVTGLISHFQLGTDHSLTLGAFIASIVVGGHQLFLTGFRNLVRLRFDMNTLMTIAVIGAALIGEWIEGAAVVILFAISEALESYSMDQARNSIQSLMGIAPKTANVIRNGEKQEVNVEDIQINDVVMIKPGEKIPVDGVVVKGETSINQAAITGESVPVYKALDDEVFAGTLNEEGYLEVRTTKLVKDTTLAKIIHLVEEAQNEKAPAQQFVDRFAAYYTPLIMLIALGVAIVPPVFFGLNFETWLYQGLAVLVVGCPCALVVSTPVAIVTAIGSAARNGVLVKGGAYLESLGHIKAIAFDKTGTITQGKPVVQSYRIFDESIQKEEFFGIASALESQSQHPLAKAIIDFTESLTIKQYDINDFQSITGKGITGSINGETYKVGSPSMFDSVSPYISDEVETLQEEGHTVVLMSQNDKVIGLIAIADAVRDVSKNMINKIHGLGMKQSVLLTGDNEKTARSISNQVGVKSFLANLLPKDKQTQIKQLHDEHGRVAMIGDGVNDAPALATADVGIAMGSAGTDTALETADIALMGDDLEKLPFTVRLSRRTLNIIKQNIAFALGLKVLALLLVIPGWLTLWIAILADMGATLLVTLNALRLIRSKETN